MALRHWTRDSTWLVDRASLTMNSGRTGVTQASGQGKQRDMGARLERTACIHDDLSILCLMSETV